MSKTFKSKCLGGAVVLAGMAMAAQAQAIEFTPNGAVVLGTTYSYATSYNPANGNQKYIDQGFALDNFGNSNVGFRAKEGDFAFRAEIGLYAAKEYTKGLEFRFLQAFWNFNGGQLMIGKAPSPYMYKSQLVYDSDAGFNGYGSLYDGRHPQIKLSLDNGFYVDLMQPKVGNKNNLPTGVNQDTSAAYGQTGTVYNAVYKDYDNYMPKVVIGYEGKHGIWKHGEGVGFNGYNIKEKTATTTIRSNVYSYVVFAHGLIDLAPVEVSYNAYHGRNLGDFMGGGTGIGAGNTLTASNSANGAYFDTLHGVDSYTYGGYVQLGYAFNKKSKMYTGVSYVVDDNKISKADERMQAFINYQHNFSKNFSVTPEVMLINDFTNTLGQKEPRIFATSIRWKMSF